MFHPIAHLVFMVAVNIYTMFAKRRFHVALSTFRTTTLIVVGVGRLAPRLFLNRRDEGKTACRHLHLTLYLNIGAPHTRVPLEVFEIRFA
jgi:hypothetical protein